FQGFHIHRGFGEPDTFRVAFEATLKVFDAPQDLRTLVARVRQRKNGVIVSLRYRRAMTGKPAPTLSITIENSLIPFRGALFHPRQQSWPEVEADTGIVVDDLRNAMLGIQ